MKRRFYRRPSSKKLSRRRFSTEFKLRVIARADSCQYGEVGELLRSEGFNTMIQKIKRDARGFRNKERSKAAIYFHLGGLDLYPEAVR